MTIERSGFATLLDAPPIPYPDAPPPPPPEPEPVRIARGEGISLTEAEQMMNPDDAAMAAAIALDQRLKAGAAGNYVGMRIVRDPRPRFAFQFRSDAAATLARFTRDPRFVSREGGVPDAELQPIFDKWWPRFQAHRLVGGGSVRGFDGVVQFDMNIDRAAFDAIAAREGWTLPERLKLNFPPPPDPRSIDPALTPLVRIFAREDRRPATVLTAALSGRLILRDGCFRLAEHGDGPQPLVIFGRDTELVLDAEGYMAVRPNAEPGPAPRIGERVVWSGPRGANEADEGVRALRAACGTGPVVAVGEPISAREFRVRPWEVDEVARSRGISREAAWEALKACWTRLDAARPGDDAGPCISAPPPPIPPRLPTPR